MTENTVAAEPLQLIKYVKEYKGEQSSETACTYSFHYLMKDAETQINVAILTDALSKCYYGQFPTALQKYEKELGLLRHDAVDENNKIIPAKHIVYPGDGSENFEHYRNGVMYNFLDMAAFYTKSGQGEIIYAYKAVEEGKILEIDGLSLAQFRMKYAMYQNKVEALARVEAATEKVSIPAENVAAAQKLTLDV